MARYLKMTYYRVRGPILLSLDLFPGSENIIYENQSSPFESKMYHCNIRQITIAVVWNSSDYYWTVNVKVLHSLPGTRSIVHRNLQQDVQMMLACWFLEKMWSLKFLPISQRIPLPCLPVQIHQIIKTCNNSHNIQLRYVYILAQNVINVYNFQSEIQLKKNTHLRLCMDILIKGSQQNLSEVEDTSICVARFDQRFHQVIRYWRFVFIMSRHSGQRFLLPTPVLQHLWRGFNKIPFYCSSTVN